MFLMFVGSLVLAMLVLALAVDVFRTRRIAGSPTEWLTLGAITAAALGLRLVYLGESSIEHLEGSYLFEAIKPSTVWDAMASRQSAEQMHQPLYVILLRGWSWLGIDEVTIRLPSAIFATACVPVLWVIARDELGRPNALWAAALTAATPLLVWYGRDATPYALLALLSLTAVASAQQSLESPTRNVLSLRTGVALSLAFYTHFHGGWVAITVGLWLLCYDRKVFLRTTAITALGCLPWTGALFHKLLVSVQGLVEDQAIMRYSHEPFEATSEAFRILMGGPSLTWIALLALSVGGALFLIRRGHRLGSLILITLGIGFLAELHILWQLQRSKGILYVDIRHYVYAAPLLLLAIAALPRHVAAAAALGLQLVVSVPMVSALEKPDVRRAAAWVTSYADGPEHGVAFLPAPWYQPIVEYYVLGVCPELVHGRSHEGWWLTKDCFQSEDPLEGSLYGFPPNPERLHASSRRRQIEYFWVIEIRDHRFGLPVPPTDPMERYECWEERDKALMQRRSFGPWVTVSLYDAQRMAMLPSPPAYDEDQPVRTVTAAEAWELPCRSSSREDVH